MKRLSQTTRDEWTRANKMRKTWVQDPKTGKMVEKESFKAEAAPTQHIIGDIEPFVSPITQKPITSRSALRAHNKEYGVTDSRDYSPEYYKKEYDLRQRTMRGETSQARQERIDTIKRAIEAGK